MCTREILDADTSEPFTANVDLDAGGPAADAP